MTSKKCSYKGCNSYTNSSHPTTETFYAFPKIPERLHLWMKLGGCLNEKELPYASRYFCSKHFDATKYVASNPRRKQLLSTAIPYPYVATSEENDLTIADDSEFQCVVSSVHPIVDEYDDNEVIKMHEDEISEGAPNEINCISESVETLESFEEEYQNCPTDFDEAIQVAKQPIKRKINHSIIKHPAMEAVPPKRTVTIVSNHPTSTINVFQHQQIDEKEAYDDDCDLGNTLNDSSNVTTFIFKGEEYIQMPKEQYNLEKMNLINKIKSYEEIFKNVKHLIDNVRI